MPLKVRDVGIRECFVPRPGYCFIDADIEALELCTLAQVEIWYLNDRRKADQINSGLDLHCITGAVIAGMEYKDFFRLAKGEDPDTGEKLTKSKAHANIRNLAKVPGFGKPGGMADKTLVSFARSSYGIKLGQTPECPKPSKEQAEAEAVRIGRYWARANPNDVDYLDFIRTRRQPDKLYWAMIGHPSIGNTIRRAKCTYCAACNTPFQGLGALAAGEISWELAQGCYNQPSSPLFGSRVVMHAYDEWLLEVKVGRQTEAGAELERIIATAGGRKVPDVRLRAEAVCMDRWAKNAERVEKNGELLIWTPDHKGN
jgi:hypothetical protein